MRRSSAAAMIVREPGIDYLPIGLNHFCSDQATCVFLPYFDYFFLNHRCHFLHFAKQANASHLQTLDL